MNLSESLPSNMNFFSSSNSSSDGTGGASGIGGWLSSLQEKSKTLVEVYKRDLGNFSVDMERKLLQYSNSHHTFCGYSKRQAFIDMTQMPVTFKGLFVLTFSVHSNYF
jgi:hypothetical protein